MVISSSTSSSTLTVSSDVNMVTLFSTAQRRIGKAVGVGPLVGAQGVDHIRHMALAQRFQDLFAALADLVRGCGCGCRCSLRN